MTPLYRTAALVIALALASGCTGSRRFQPRTGDVRLPSAPVLEPSPAVVDPDKAGTVGSPAPAPERRDFPATPTLSPFGE
ncbi:hypothetical protein [Paludisphaera soli]|uniref:hypothetical protein n=1 Tax=Paludisphaera soli TaxID=2712865 RepID=UPI0013EBE65F|nr:hypothetical protein [Paludisphaera soli]